MFLYILDATVVFFIFFFYFLFSEFNFFASYI